MRVKLVCEEVPVNWNTLALLLFTGLYLFVLPYATRWRSGRTV